MYNKIGYALQLLGESDKPFSYFGLVTDLNGIDTEQYRDYIQISYHKYIDRVMRSHRFIEKKSVVPAKPPSLLPPDSLKKLFSHSGPK